MSRWNRLAYWMARFFFQQSGEVGVDPYFRLEAQRDAERITSARYIAKLELELSPLRWQKELSEQVVHDLALVDGLLSQKQYSEAQGCLRVALIKLRGRPSSRNDLLQQMANAQQNSLNRGGGVLGGGGLGNSMSHVDRLFGNMLRGWE